MTAPVFSWFAWFVFDPISSKDSSQKSYLLEILQSDEEKSRLCFCNIEYNESDLNELPVQNRINKVSKIATMSVSFEPYKS